MLTYGYVIIVLWRSAPRAAGWAGIAFAAAAFFLIAWDRPYDGAHWPSDVVGAVLIGVLVLALLEYLPRRFVLPAMRRARDATFARRTADFAYAEARVID